MAKNIFDMLAPPPHWRVFEPLLRELGDETWRIDPLGFMEAIGPAFLQHASATMPRRITKPLGGKRSPNQVTHYILSHGRHRGGPYAYRIISIDHAGSIGIADTTRLPDESDIFGRQAGAHSGLSKLKARQASHDKDPRDTLTKFGGAYADMATGLTTYDALFDGIFEKHRLLERVVRRVQSSSTWVSDLSFIEDDDLPLFKGSHSSRNAVVDEMMKAAKDLIGTRFDDMPKRDFIKRKLYECLENFDAEMGRAAHGVVAEIRRQLDREAMEIMAVNPSGVTTRNYGLLTRSRKADIPPLWREAARACPIILLMQDRLLRDQELLQMAEGGFDPDKVVSYYFGATDPQRLEFYKSLTEETVGLHNAERLQYLARHLEKLDGLLPDPKNPKDWDTLATLVDAANHIAMILGRDSDRVLRDLINSDEREPTDTIYRHFSLRDRGGRFSSIMNLGDWRDFIISRVLVPKVLVESQKRNLNIPIRHIFYMVAGDPKMRRDLSDHIRIDQSRAIEGFRKEHSFLAEFFEGMSADRLLDSAHSFGTHKLAWEQQIKDRLLSNRLYESAAEFLFPALPEIRDLDEFDTVTPIRRMDELLKECRDLQDFSLMNLGHLVAKKDEGVHFVTVRGRDKQTRAIACIEEPKGPFDAWKIRDIVTDPAPHRNASARGLVERYISHERFLEHADVEQLSIARTKLQDSLLSRAKDRELMGFKVGDAAERHGVLEAMNPYIKVAGGWRIDPDGCIDAPKLNAMVAALLRQVGPHYPKLAA
ncbi:MAG: hypothetical protein EBQ96_01100 [Proteobacteria bacterium]|nr:hypothetical protein [Pseudomonadota bacterium]